MVSQQQNVVLYDKIKSEPTTNINEKKKIITKKEN